MKIFLLIIFCLCCLGCSKGLVQDLNNNISEVREFVVFGERENIMATLTCGYREDVYKIDGVSNNLIPFGVITVFVDGSYWNNKNVEYNLFVGTEKYSGFFEVNPFDESYVVDLKKIVDRNQNILLEVICGYDKTSIKLHNVDDNWKMKSRDCLNVVAKHYKNELKSFYKKGNFEGEVYIKILNNKPHLNQFYYYVSIIGRDGKSINMVMSPVTSEILASNNNTMEDLKAETL